MLVWLKKAQPDRATTTHNFEAVHTFVYVVHCCFRFAQPHRATGGFGNEELKDAR